MHQRVLDALGFEATAFDVLVERLSLSVPAGARVRLRVVLVGIEPREGGQVIMKTLNTMEVEGSDRPALIAETLALLVPASGANRP